jgi:hypothetical protein
MSERGYTQRPTATRTPVPATMAWPRPLPSAFTAAPVETEAQPDLQTQLATAQRMQVNWSQMTVGGTPSVVQPKLTVGAPGDQYEQEADRVADQVMSMPDAATPDLIQREAAPEDEELQTKPLAAAITPLVQREMAPETEEVQAKPLGNSIQREAMPEEEELQAKSLGNGTLQREAMPEEEEAVQMKGAPDAALPAGSNLENRLSSSQGGGNPLPDEVRSFMEPRFGADFGQVRVHTGSEAVQMNRDLNAQAFTHKQDVYFGAGKAPGKDALTAHELTHVVQQTDKRQFNLAEKSELIQQKCKMCDQESVLQRAMVADPVILEEPIRKNAQACLVHLHGDEKEALETAKQLHKDRCSNLVHIAHPGRTISIINQNAKVICRADPNRIFDDESIKKQCHSKTAQEALYKYRDEELSPKIRQCRGMSLDQEEVEGSGLNGNLPVISFHNNTNQGGLTIKSYLPGGKEAVATEDDKERTGQIDDPSIQNPHIEKGQDVDNFMLVTTKEDFLKFRELGRNVVLQKLNLSKKAEDGSLSVALKNEKYINVEAQHGQFDTNMAMGGQALDALGVNKCNEQILEQNNIQRKTSPDVKESSLRIQKFQNSGSQHLNFPVEYLINSVPNENIFHQNNKDTIQRHSVQDGNSNQQAYVSGVHYSANTMLSRAYSLSYNGVNNPVIQQAVFKHFSFLVPSINGDPANKKLWNHVLWALYTMLQGCNSAVYEIELSQSWFDGWCWPGVLAVSLDNIHLCPRWWRYGFNQQAATLIHEWGHKYGQGVNRVFETYSDNKDYKSLPAEEKVKLPDAYADYVSAVAFT